MVVEVIGVLERIGSLSDIVPCERSEQEIGELVINPGKLSLTLLYEVQRPWCPFEFEATWQMTSLPPSGQLRFSSFVTRYSLPGNGYQHFSSRRQYKCLHFIRLIYSMAIKKRYLIRILFLR